MLNRHLGAPDLTPAMSVTNSLLLAAAVVAVIIDHPVLGVDVKTPLNGRKVVLMSMDGFRHDYLSKSNNTPNFDALIASGAKVPYVNNTFTTLTFPCHYTIVTGLYEESHGIVGNKMYDPLFNATFGMRNLESRWWNGSEPIWTRAVKAGLKVGTYFWPGSHTVIDNVRPTEWRPYEGKVSFKDRVDILVNTWLSKENFDLGIIYFNEPDHTGHEYGPDAPEMVPAIERMDGILGYFMKRLEEENLKDKVDFILTSDHGMTGIHQKKKTIGIRNYVNETLLLDIVGGGAIAHLRPQPGKANELVQALSGIDHMTVYLKEDIPDRYHYKHHRRVMPVVVVADEGYEIRKKSSKRHYLKGTHGYSTDYMSMKPIFIASGPSFKQGVEVDPIKSVDIYPLLCHLLNIDPAPNNGSFDRVKALLRPPSVHKSTPSSDRMYSTAKINNAGVTSPSTATNSMNGRKVVLMSMDGFRHDYLSKSDNTPNFDALIASGAKVPYVNNTFTTKTFPCHYTIVTGRYEESHGIVGNKMYDPIFQEKFKMSNVESRWWDGAEPIWTNAVKSGLKVGTYFWPGTEAELEGVRPTEWRPYTYKVSFKDRVDILVNTWLSKENFDLGIIYFNEPDHTGHKYGPDAPEMVPAIERMDRILGYFMKRLEEENLKDKVDFILTSDHGMTTIYQDKKIIGIKDQVDMSLLRDFVGGGAIAHLLPQPGKAKELARALSGIDHMTVYLKEDIPDRYHYKHHRRIMPVVVVADEGYEIRKKSYPTHYNKGAHGYSTDYMSMKPIFIASGPSFKQGVEVDPIKSVDIYPLLCHLLNLDPAPNDGSFDRVKALLRPTSVNKSSTPSSDRMYSTASVTSAPTAHPSTILTPDNTTTPRNTGDMATYNMVSFHCLMLFFPFTLNLMQH